MRERYHGFGPTLPAERLAGRHGCAVSREALRQGVVADGLWRDRRGRLPAPRQPRWRRDCLGEPVRIDGSAHAWFEDRGPPCAPLAFVDHATSQPTGLRLVASEAALPCLTVTRAHTEAHSKPVAVHPDKHGVSRVNRRQHGRRAHPVGPSAPRPARPALSRPRQPPRPPLTDRAPSAREPG